MKRFLAAILAVMMVLALVGCGEKPAAEAPAAGAPAAAAPEAGSKPAEITTVKMAVLTVGDTSDSEKVVAKANELLAKDGLAIEVQFIKFSTWREQTNLLATGGKGSIDILPIWNQPLFTMVPNGALMPIDELYEQYKDQLAGLFTQAQMSACYYDGQLYGIPTERDLAANRGIVMRKDILDELGVKAEDIKNFADVEELLLKVKETHTELYPLVPHHGASLFGAGWDWDTLGTGNLGVLTNKAQESTVVNLFEDEGFLKICETMKRWNTQGLIMPDVLSNTEMGSALIAAGKGFAYLSTMKAGFAEQETISCGTQMVTAELAPAMACTNNVQSLLWCLSSNCENPEAAMKVMVKLYTDPELAMLLINGIEGENWVYANEEKTLINFPEGKNGANTTYCSAGWAWPNQYITAPWVPNPTDIWEQLDKFNADAIASVALGFMPNLSEVANEVTACTNVYNKYFDALTSGTVDVEETVAAMNAELETAGLQKIIDLKQAQLNDWLAAK